MKIEIGESLIVSWLKHVKNCQVVQSNWKPSTKTWDSYQENEVIDLIEILGELFAKSYSMNVFPKNASVGQFIQQGEIDVLGVEVRKLKVEKLFAVDVAFHENGLNYGRSKEDTAARVLKKMIRSLVQLMTFFEATEGEVIFATPKLNRSVSEILMPSLEELNDFLWAEDLKFNCRVIANEGFKKKIFDGVNEVAGDVADTSELFMRSLQMVNLLSSSKITKASLVNKKKGSKPQKPDRAIEGAESEMKIGILVRTTFKELSEDNLLDETEVKNLQDPEYSKQWLNNNFAVLKKVENKANLMEERQVNGYYRYYAQPLRFNGKEYLLTNDWYEWQREPFLNWLIRVKKKS